MSTKSHNAKKPKLAHLPSSPTDNPTEGAEPGKHHVSFAQHQHGQQALPPDPPRQEVKSDPQQHQQKPSHK